MRLEFGSLNPWAGNAGFDLVEFLRRNDKQRDLTYFVRSHAQKIAFTKYMAAK